MRGNPLFHGFGNDEMAPLDPQPQETKTVLDHCGERDRLLLQFVPPRFDPRQIENFVDEHQEVLAAGVNVAGIFLVGRHRVRAEQFALHHFGEAEDGVERGAQLMAHRRQKARLGQLAPSARRRASSELSLACSSSAMSESFSA